MSAPVLLGMLAARHYGWAWLPVDVRGIASKALGALLALGLMWMLYKAKPSRPLLYVVLYGTFEELQTVICSVAYALSPWTVAPGNSICSARLDFDLGAIGVMLLTFTLLRVCQYVGLTATGKPGQM